MKNIVYTLLFSLAVISCSQDYPEWNETAESTRDLKVPEGFDFSMTQTVSAEIFVNINGVPLSRVPLDVYYEDPGSSVEPNPDAKRSYLLLSDDEGMVREDISVPAYLTALYLKTDFIGLPDVVRVELSSGSLLFQYGEETGFEPVVPMIRSGALKNGLTVEPMGTFSSNGVPDYLEKQRDQLSKDFLERINASLPEGRPLPDSHPDYLTEGNEADIIVKEDADVWVTFVHEGAGYLNTLAYYVYDQANPPQQVSDIQNVTAIFPNASFVNSGGGLRSGDKVYLGQFKAGQAIGWILFANGWSRGRFNTQSPRFSDYRFNPESTNDLKRHMVLLYDEKEEVLLMGFEDMHREMGSDDDFNDAVFYVTANPIEAIEISHVPPVDTPEDNDGDGISNTFDDFPDDPELAFDYHYPAENQYGTLVVEDLWPSLGDFDFNDLVIDYHFHQMADPENRISKMSIDLQVRAIGASFRNGFGMELPIPVNQIRQVEGHQVSGEVVKLLSNGLEANQSHAVIIFFEDAFDVLPFSGSGPGLNTSMDQPYAEPGRMQVSLTFATPLKASSLGFAPYNPFVFVNGDRSKEIHLVGHAPTDLADPVFFGTRQDDTRPGESRYYQSEGNLPWMLNIPEQFVYPREKMDIIEGYTWFSAWAVNGGQAYPDWYTRQEGYRDDSKLYTR